MTNKLTRKQLREGLDQIPIETILLGSSRGDSSLTNKQKEFAKGVALGKTKAQSYRDAYNAKGKPKTVGDNASRLASDSRVQTEIEAYRLALEAEKHRTPAQLRSLVIHQLTKHALNEDVPPAQRIKSLELLGKVAEVGAFVDRKETTVITQSENIKSQLLDKLQSFMSSKTIDMGQAEEADSLLAELAEAKSKAQPAEPTTAPPSHIGDDPSEIDTHSIPHTQSTDISISIENSSSQVIDLIEEINVTGTSSSENSIEEGVSPTENRQEVSWEDVEMTPLGKSEEK